MTTARDERGRLLDVPADAGPEEIKASVARLDAEDTRNIAALARLGIVNGHGPGWHDR